MSPKVPGETDEQRKARQRAEVAAYEKTNDIVPGTASHRGDGAGGGPSGGISWGDYARMAAARLAAYGPGGLNDRDRIALAAHPDIEAAVVPNPSPTLLDLERGGTVIESRAGNSPLPDIEEGDGPIQPADTPAHDHDREVGMYGDCITCAKAVRAALGTRPAVDRDTTRVSAEHPQTAHTAAARILPQTGSLRRAVIETIRANGPMTDDGLEVALERSHQSVSASRNSLVHDGWLEDSGETAPIRNGNDAILWRLVP